MTSSGARLTTFADLFCGVGGFHVAASNLGLKCVFASDIDSACRYTYEENHGLRPVGDITRLASDAVPEHDIMFAGLPCQPFSIIGKREGFSDPRGNLFLEMARIIAVRKPFAVVIENVRQFVTNSSGEAFRCVTTVLEALGYHVRHRILDARDFGLPQKRERVIIVASSIPLNPWPRSVVPMRPLREVLEDSPSKRHFVSERIRLARKRAHVASVSPSIWHENKGGNVSSHPYSCALRAGASYNYLLVNGERRLTAREMFRLQGFPDSFKIPRVYGTARRLIGNAVPVPMVQAVIHRVLEGYAAALGESGGFQPPSNSGNTTAAGPRRLRAAAADSGVASGLTSKMRAPRSRVASGIAAAG